MAAKRHLPIVQSNDSDAGPPRARWQWVGFGVLAIFVVWLPLEAAASATSAGSLPVFALLSIGVLAVASFAGGFMVGRWGGPDVGPRDAALSGLVAAVVAIALSWVSSGIVVEALLVIVASVPMAAWGGNMGKRARHAPRTR
jgi:putative Mn2+ efflux pump MntP